jgi:uncharacterized short protein YbdD (DUF466 family)
MTLRQAVQGVRWYLREVSGEGDYDRYVARARCQHAEADVLSRREFERRKMSAREANPGARCC